MDGTEFVFPDAFKKQKGRLLLVDILLSIKELDISGYTLKMGLNLTHQPTFTREVRTLVDTAH